MFRHLDFLTTGGLHFGPALELVTGFATAPSTTFTALTMATGNSSTVRNCPDTKMVKLLEAWTDKQTAGAFRIRSPKLHDNVQGIRLADVASIVQGLLPSVSAQRLYPQDTLTLEVTGSGTAGDIETACMLIYYEDLPGSNARFIDRAEVQRRAVNMFTVENTIALGTAGGYSGEEAINAEFDLFKANTDYALLGYNVAVECACVRWRGADVGNYGLGGPGSEDLKPQTKDWFARISEKHGLPLIPVFNSANKFGILVDGAQDENGADTTLTSIFAELAPR